MSIANKIIPHYTYEDWIHWEGSWELIEGHPIAMSPTPIPAHQRVAAELTTALTLALRQAKCKDCFAYNPLDYKISEDTILVPDVLVICGEIKKKYLDFPPALVIEILSPSTALRDRHTKYELYQKEGVKYYLIVNIDTKTIEIFELINDLYQLRSDKNNFKFNLDNNCSIEPELGNIFS
jgi:Uma2 family endonuclease